MPKVGTFTGEIVKSTRPKTYNAIVEDLAQERTVVSVARSRRVSDNTVRGIAKVEAERIARRKKTLACMFETLAERSIRRANKTVGQASFAQACVGAGIAAQRMMELRGEHRSDVGLTINLLNLTSGSP